ncbi:hypothetical protein HDU93_004056, partial [Gonapodya sp. JEL0774]
MVLDADPDRPLLPRFRQESITPVFGTIVHSAELGNLTDQDILDVSDLISVRGVIHFPGQEKLSLDDQIAFSKRFGELHRFPSVKSLDGYPEVLRIQVDGKSNYSFGSG